MRTKKFRFGGVRLVRGACFEVSAPLTYIEFVVQKPADPDEKQADALQASGCEPTAGTVRSGHIIEDCTTWNMFNQAKLGLPTVNTDGTGPTSPPRSRSVGVLYNAVARTTILA